MVEVGVTLPDEHIGYSPEETIRWGVRAESFGFDSIWKGETYGTNAPMVLTALSRATTDIKLGTGVVNVYSRSPALLAMTAATLADLSDGRLRLGVGASSPNLVETWHGQEYDRPLRRVRETIEILREIWESGHADYDGAIFDIGPMSSKYVQTEYDIPIYNSAVGPVNRKLTGEHADGWMPVFSPLSGFSSMCSEIRDSAKAAGRDPDDIVVAPWIPIGVDPTNPHQAERLVRDLIAQELAMGYDKQFDSLGYGDVARDASQTWLDGNRDTAAELLTDEIVKEFGVFGTPSDVRTKLGEYIDAGADELILWNSFSANENQIEAVLEAVSPNSHSL